MEIETKRPILRKSTGKIHDEHLYGLFKKDWKKRLPELKKKLNAKIKRLKNEKP